MPAAEQQRRPRHTSTGTRAFDHRDTLACDGMGVDPAPSDQRARKSANMSTRLTRSSHRFDAQFIGITAALSARCVLRTMLFDVSPTDLVTYASIVVRSGGRSAHREPRS